MPIFVAPILLMSDGEAHARLLPESAQGRGVLLGGSLAVASAWAAAALLWFDHPQTRPARKRIGYRNGRELMLRFPLPDRGRRRRRDPREEAVALAVVASYPLWWWLGWDHGRRARPGDA
jgi:hypothetical protein